MRSRKEQIDSNKLIGSGTALERRGCRPEVFGVSSWGRISSALAGEGAWQGEPEGRRLLLVFPHLCSNNVVKGRAHLLPLSGRWWQSCFVTVEAVFRLKMGRLKVSLQVGLPTRLSQRGDLQ